MGRSTARHRKNEGEQKVKKVRRRRKMTPEQREAASKRLAEARAKKAPAELKNVHDDVKALPPDHDFSVENVKKWIKSNKQKLPSLKVAARKNEKDALAKLLAVEAYIRHCEIWLRDAVWLDLFWGEHQEHSCGTVKKTIVPHEPKKK